MGEKKTTHALLTPHLAARQLGISESTLRAHANSGRIPCQRLADGSRVFRAADIETERERRYQSQREARRNR